MIEKTKHEWEEMEDQKRMRGDGSNVERKEKKWKENDSQHGTKCEWEEMEDQERMKGDGSNIERREKKRKEKNSQHGTKHLVLKKTTKGLGYPIM